MTDTTNVTRRQFLRIAAAGTVAVPLLVAVAPRSAHADDLPHLAESDPTATALGYREDVAKVDAAKYPQRKAGQTCANCNFYQGKAGDKFGPCQLFPGKAVSVGGWCGGFAAKP